MKNILILSLAVVAFLATPACKKSKGSSNSNEARLTVQTTPANGTTDAPAPGPDFPLLIQITSAMPPSGVKIQVTAKKDGSSDPAFFTTAPPTSTSATNNIVITGTPATVICLVNITITSVSDPTNVWNGSYRYSKK